MSPHAPELFERTSVSGHRVISGRCAIVPPKTNHHSKKIIRRGPFSSMADSDKLVAAKATWQTALAPFAPPAPLEGPIRLELELTWPWRKGDSRKVRALGHIPCIVKPDWDNSAKGIADALVLLGFLRADQQIVDGRVTKWIGDHPGLVFRLEEIAP